MRRRQQGFTLIEVMLAVVLIGVVLMTLVMAFMVSYATAKDARMLQVAQRLAELKMDAALVDPLVSTMPSYERFTGLEGYQYRLTVRDFPDPSGAGRTEIEVIVRYTFLQGHREYKVVAWRYGF